MSSKNRSFGNLQYLSIAGCSLDFALLVSNIQQVKFIVDSGKENVQYFDFLLILLVVSIFLQFLAVIFMFLVNTNEMASRGVQPPVRSNNSGIWQKLTLTLVMLIAVMNVFIAVFGERSNNTILRKMRVLEGK